MPNFRTGFFSSLLSVSALMLLGIGFVSCNQLPTVSYVTSYHIDDTASNQLKAKQCIETVASVFGLQKLTNYTNRLVTYGSSDGMLAAWTGKADGNLYTNDITDLEMLAFRLKKPTASDRVSQYLRKELSAETVAQLSNYSGGLNPPLQEALADDLGHIMVLKGPLYDAERFSNVELSTRTLNMMTNKVTGLDLYRLNRLLLHDAYPREIRSMETDFVLIYYQKYTQTKDARYLAIEKRLDEEVRKLFGADFRLSSYSYAP